MPTVRPATADDIAALAELEREALHNPWSAATLATELEHPGALTLVVEEEAEPSGEAVAGSGPDDEPPARALLGYATWRSAADEAELMRIAVQPGARRRGVASALLAAGDAALHAAGHHTCFLEVRRDNTGAIALYEALGFHRIGRRPGYYDGSVDALLYGRPVRQATAAESGSEDGARSG